MDLLKVTSVFWILLSACLAGTPQEAEPAVQGDYKDGNTEHRPGQPCLLCHGEEGHFPQAPGKITFKIAGTVFPDIDSPEDEGIKGAEIIFTDANGNTFTAQSNNAGNFMVQVDSGLSEPKQRGKGKLKIPQDPVFPLRVKIRYKGIERAMRTKIWRNGSCAHCHGESPSAASVGRVYVFPEVVEP